MQDNMKRNNIRIIGIPEGEKGRCNDVDPGPQDPCAVEAIDKYTWTTEILWSKRDGMATL